MPMLESFVQETAEKKKNLKHSLRGVQCDWPFVKSASAAVNRLRCRSGRKNVRSGKQSRITLNDISDA